MSELCKVGEIQQELANIHKTLSSLRTEQMELLVVLTELNRRYKEQREDKINIKTLVIIMLISYILFLGEKVKDLLNIEVLKLFL